jgi:hypothetical protein
MEMRVVLSSENEGINSASEFSTELLQPLVLSDKWKVALTEITIPQSIINFTEEHFVIFETFHLGTNNEEEVLSSTKIQFEKDSIASLDELQDKLTKKFMEKGIPTSIIIFNRNTFKAEISLQKGERIKLSRGLSLIFSMERVMENVEDEEVTFFSEYCIDVRMYFWNIYIYSNLTKPIILGERLSPLLQTLPIEEFEKKRLLTKSYNPRVFLPLAKYFIPKVYFKICDELGRPLKFVTPGDTICKLLFVKDGFS